MRKVPQIVACIPAYNEERTIAGIVLKTQRYVDKVIVCDDGSQDLTGEIARRMGAEVIEHDRNMGYGAALASLFRRALEIGADVVVTLDADGQHDPSFIPQLVDPIARGEADLVIGSRFIAGSGDIPLYRRVGIRLITALTRWFSKSDLTDAQSGLRAYRREALEAVIPTEAGMGASTEILLRARRANLRIREVPVVVDYNVEGRSSKNPLVHGIEVVLSTIKHYSLYRPLLFYGVPGLAALSVSGVMWVKLFQIFAATRRVVTNVALAAIGSTITGLVLITTALMLWTIVSLVRDSMRAKATQGRKSSRNDQHSGCIRIHAEA